MEGNHHKSRDVIRRRSSVVGRSALIGGLGLGLAACGGAGGIAATTPPSTTPATAATTSTTSTTTLAPATTVPIAPAAVLHATDSGGDSITTTYSFGPTEPISSSNVDQSLVSNCGFDTSRALVVAAQMATVNNASLKVNVEETFLWSSMDPGPVYFVLAYSDGTKCESPSDNPNVNFPLQPHSRDTFDFWVVLDGAITPNYPSGDPATLGEWDLQEPQVLLEGNSLVNVTMSGSRVISCQDQVGDQYLFLVPTGSLPRQIGGNYYGDSCTKA
jgi:hypothetical protein